MASPDPVPLGTLPQRMVVMGVAGCGKTSVGVALAARIGATFRDGDDLHPAANVAKMTAGQPLTDDDRWPWLAKVGQALRGPALESPGRQIIGCSALKRAYREKITAMAGGPVTFILLDGSYALIKARMDARTGHFMPPSLLKSQFATLEVPGPDENAVQVSIDQPLAGIVADIVALLAHKAG